MPDSDFCPVGDEASDSRNCAQRVITVGTAFLFAWGRPSAPRNQSSSVRVVVGSYLPAEERKTSLNYTMDLPLSSKGRSSFLSIYQAKRRFQDGALLFGVRLTRMYSVERETLCWYNLTASPYILPPSPKVSFHSYSTLASF